MAEFDTGDMVVLRHQQLQRFGSRAKPAKAAGGFDHSVLGRSYALA